MSTTASSAVRTKAACVACALPEVLIPWVNPAPGERPFQSWLHETCPPLQHVQGCHVELRGLPCVESISLTMLFLMQVQVVGRYASDLWSSLSDHVFTSTCPHVIHSLHTSISAESCCRLHSQSSVTREVFYRGYMWPPEDQ